MKPLVSILIPCFNAEPWISEAIESALAQTWENKEIIVIDDGSTDGSLEVIRSFGDQIHFETGPNQGGNVARNRLLELSNGERLQYLDADDYLLPEKIENQINHDADVVFSPSLIASDGNIEQLPIDPPHDDPWILLARWSLPQTGSPLWTKQAIVDAGGWKNDQPCCQEHELYLRLLKNNASFQFVPNSGSVYRKWSDQTVCERDPIQVITHRLAIEDEIERHLKSINQLSSERRAAINQARFESARSAWKHDRKLARSIAQIDPPLAKELPP